jgi:hypothetical protein
MLLQQAQQGRLIQPLLTGEGQQVLTPHLREADGVQIRQRVILQQEAAWLPVAQHSDNRQPILGRRRAVGRVPWMADKVAVLVLSLDPRSSVIQVVPRAPAQSGQGRGVLLSVEGGLILDPSVRAGALRDLDAHLREEFHDLRFTHLTGVIQDQRQRCASGAKLSPIPGRQRGQVGLARAGGVIFLLVKADVIRLDDDILADDVLVALELHLGRPGGRIEGPALRAVDRQLGVLGALHTVTGHAPLLRGGTVEGRRVRRGRWLPLFALQPIDLIPQPLIVLPPSLVFLLQLFPKVEQQQDALAGGFVLDAAEIKGVQHGVVYYTCCSALLGG